MRANILVILASTFLSWPVHARGAWNEARTSLESIDEVRAVPALRLAAGADRLRAQEVLASMPLHGESFYEVLASMPWHGESFYAGVPANRVEALEWFGKAARGGSDGALHLLRGWAQRCSADAARTLVVSRP